MLTPPCSQQFADTSVSVEGLLAALAQCLKRF
jgi:hypothetical protein